MSHVRKAIRFSPKHQDRIFLSVPHDRWELSKVFKKGYSDNNDITLICNTYPIQTGLTSTK